MRKLKSLVFNYCYHSWYIVE